MIDIFSRLIKREGGYINDPDDPGGETKYGISKRSYPDLDIASLTPAMARAIYMEDYFLKYGLHRLPPSLQEQMLDFAVLSGPITAIKTLQRVLDTKPDGIIGPLTVKLAQNKGVGNKLAVRRAKFLASLVRKRPSNLKYLEGWIARALEFVE